MDVGEGDEVGFVVMGGKGEEGVADLFDVNGTAEGGFLTIVPFELFVEKERSVGIGQGGEVRESAYLDAVFGVLDTVGSDRRMVASRRSGGRQPGSIADQYCT